MLMQRSSALLFHRLLPPISWHLLLLYSQLQQDQYPWVEYNTCCTWHVWGCLDISACHLLQQNFTDLRVSPLPNKIHRKQLLRVEWAYVNSRGAPIQVSKMITAQQSTPVRKISTRNKGYWWAKTPYTTNCFEHVSPLHTTTTAYDCVSLQFNFYLLEKEQRCLKDFGTSQKTTPYAQETWKYLA